MTPLTTITRQFSAALERERSTLSEEAILAGERIVGEFRTVALNLNRDPAARSASLRMLGRRVDAFEKARQQVRGH